MSDHSTKQPENMVKAEILRFAAINGPFDTLDALVIARQKGFLKDSTNAQVMEAIHSMIDFGELIYTTTRLFSLP